MASPRLKLLSAGLVAAVLALARLPLSAAAMQPPKAVVPKDSMRITEDTVLTAGTYDLKEGIEIAADGVTLDGGGATLTGLDHKGSAVRAVGRKNVTIKNIKAESYYHGIRLEDCQDVTLLDSRITDTAELDFGKQWLDLWTRAEEAYGAGIILIRVRGGRVAGNDLEHQQNGISMYSCSGLTIEKNNASYESGWGIHLYDSSDNVIQDNLADFCDRVHFRSWGDYVGADAAGLVMVSNSCRNKVLRNFFRAGGDGIFVTTGHGGKSPCNNNIFEGNDCSLSPNNAIESTFCEGNIFRKNKANDSNFGFWLGGSRKNEVTENEIIENRHAGIAIDHGNSMTISKNVIQGNRYGVLLWARRAQEENSDQSSTPESHSYIISDNQIESNRVGIYSVTTSPGEPHCYNYTITGNKINDNRIGIRLERTKDCKIEANTMSGNVVQNIRLIESTGITTSGNLEGEPPMEDPDKRGLPREVH